MDPASREVLPFLLMLVGVENTFAITNAVTSTSIDLPVKERVGLGTPSASGPRVVAAPGNRVE